MNKRKIALGPGAASLILIVVVLSLCMLAMLAQIGSKNDLSLATRSAEMITRVYALQDQTERRMAELDAVLTRCGQEAGTDRAAYLALVEENLPAGMTLEEDTVSWAEQLKDPSVECRAKLTALGDFPCAKSVSKEAGYRMEELEEVLLQCREATGGDQEAYLASVKESLPEGMTLEEDEIFWTEPLDNRTMECQVKLADPGEMPRAEWTGYRLKVEEPEDDWGLF